MRRLDQTRFVCFHVRLKYIFERWYTKTCQHTHTHKLVYQKQKRIQTKFYSDHVFIVNGAFDKHFYWFSYCQIDVLCENVLFSQSVLSDNQNFSGLNTLYYKWYNYARPEMYRHRYKLSYLHAKLTVNIPSLQNNSGLCSLGYKLKTLWSVYISKYISGNITGCCVYVGFRTVWYDTQHSVATLTSWSSRD